MKRRLWLAGVSLAVLAIVATAIIVYLSCDETRECRATLEGHDMEVVSIAWSPDGKAIASGYQNKWDMVKGTPWQPCETIALWDVATKVNVAVLKGRTDRVCSVAFTPDGKTLASGGQGPYPSLGSFVGEPRPWGVVEFWDTATASNIATLDRLPQEVFSVAFSPDGKTLASGMSHESDKMVNLWDASTHKLIAAFEGHAAHVRTVAWSPDGKVLASGGEDKTINLWDLGTSKNTSTLEGHTFAVLSVTFSPDGRTLASGSWDKTIKLWDLATGKNTATLKGHWSGVLSVTFSPDGKTLASGGRDNKVKLWDISSGRCIATLKGHKDRVWSVAWSPDGKTLASGSDDKTIKLWDVGEKTDK